MKGPTITCLTYALKSHSCQPRDGKSPAWLSHAWQSYPDYHMHEKYTPSKNEPDNHKLYNDTPDNQTSETICLTDHTMTCMTWCQTITRLNITRLTFTYLQITRLTIIFHTITCLTTTCLPITRCGITCLTITRLTITFVPSVRSALFSLFKYSINLSIIKKCPFGIILSEYNRNREGHKNTLTWVRMREPWK